MAGSGVSGRLEPSDGPSACTTGVLGAERLASATSAASTAALPFSLSSRFEMARREPHCTSSSAGWQVVAATTLNLIETAKAARERTVDRERVAKLTAKHTVNTDQRIRANRHISRDTAL